MNSIPIGQAVLRKVFVKLGGANATAERVGVSVALIRSFLSGATPVPDQVLLIAVDIVLEGVQSPSEAPRAQTTSSSPARPE